MHIVVKMKPLEDRRWSRYGGGVVASMRFPDKKFPIRLIITQKYSKNPGAKACYEKCSCISRFGDCIFSSLVYEDVSIISRAERARVDKG
jgi:hypothetical protein